MKVGKIVATWETGCKTPYEEPSREVDKAAELSQGGSLSWTSRDTTQINMKAPWNTRCL